ncbi:hypothetical protein TNCT_512141 [Trichonephila clavata]|uniref:Uncharacterized protein n=1 Tax=Trichonephila clavata TaxID=2740835 RepID=A0A8X6HXA8_TRICU|nr:hypothetical protein TNCT_512141 [Trichonephila clavata]
MGIDVPLELAAKSCLPELAEILLRKLRDARTISSKNSLELQHWMECSAELALVESGRILKDEHGGNVGTVQHNVRNRQEKEEQGKRFRKVVEQARFGKKEAGRRKERAVVE